MTDDDLCATWDGMDNELRDRSEQVYLWRVQADRAKDGDGSVPVRLFFASLA